MTGKTNDKQERKSVIELIRVSSLAQTAEDKYGIPAQKEACERIAKLLSLDIKWSYQIEDVSGTAVRRSPKMKELLKIVKSGLCDGIVMKEESRLMREHDSEVIKMLQEHKVKLYLPDSVIDFSKPTDELMGSVKFAFTKYERELIRARMVGGKNAKRRRGEWPSGANSVPYGLELYRQNKASLLRADPAKIDRVVRLFESFITGGGFTSFAQLSRQTGIPYDSIDYILHNEIYTGWHVTRKTADPARNVYRNDGSLAYQKRRLIPVEERERVRMLDDAPISEKIFAQAQRLLALRKEMKVKIKEGAADPFLFRGLLRCAECGRRIITLSYTNKKANNFHAEYYVCIGAHGERTPKKTWRTKSGTCPTRRIRREALEDIIEGIISLRFTSKKFLAEIMEEQAEADTVNAQEKLDRLNLEIEEALRAIDRNQMLFVRGKIDQESFDRTDAQLQLELRASRVELEKTRPDLGRITPEMWVPIALAFKRWKKLPSKDKRALLSSVSPTFEVSGLPGKRYHETIIKVKGFRVNLAGAGKDRNDATLDEDGEDSGGPGLVSISSRTYTGLDTNQSSIYLKL